VSGLSIGLLELPEAESPAERYAPAVTPDGRYHLWMVGEAFDGGGFVEVLDPVYSRTLHFRRLLLLNLLGRGVDAIAKLDGEYQIVLWDARDRILVLLNDRFGGIPLYWSRSPKGFAFAGGVRGILMAPGIRCDPDPEAIREAVTFGGYRLGDRTNVVAVKMVPGASVVTVREAHTTFRRYWRWADLPARPSGSIDGLIDEAQSLWQRAIRLRLSGATRPGETLSGGLDSRAILAEAAQVTPTWTAITYGLAGCDDARYARRAAEAMGVTWVFHHLYSGRNPDWLDVRTSYVQEVDGLIDLTDLMHLEVLPLQSALMDLYLSGYIGDAVSGPTFNDVVTSADVLRYLPFYETRVGLSRAAALARVEEQVSALDGAPARFAVFEHKLPQSTNRISAACRSWLRLRKPFVDYAVFDFWQSLPSELRGRDRLYERWLRSRYPVCFREIPNQKTGLPILAPSWRLALARGRRLAWRTIQPSLVNLGLSARPRLRYYHADQVFWRVPQTRERIEGMILRQGSLSCEIFGRESVLAVLSDWFDRLAVPTQVIGALYVYEAYHSDLQRHLDAARWASITRPVGSA
jgi:asparagine synthase (glutamine-hydrolysing)